MWTVSWIFLIFRLWALLQYLCTLFHFLNALFALLGGPHICVYIFFENVLSHVIDHLALYDLCVATLLQSISVVNEVGGSGSKRLRSRVA